MANKYYSRTFPFAERTKAKGEEVRSEYDAIQAGMDDVDVDTARSLKLPAGFNIELEPNDTLRANKILAFDVDGDIVLADGVGNPRGDYTTGAVYQQRDFFRDAAGVLGLNNIYIATEPFTATNLTDDQSKFVLLIDMVAVTTALNLAIAAQQDAETAADAAAVSATNAGISESAAATQAGISTTQAGNSATSATQAGNARDHAQEWANKTSGQLVSSAAGGNGSDDYSARHQAGVAQGHAQNAQASAVAAANSAEAIENERIEWVPGGYDSERIYIVNEAFSYDGSSYIVINTAEGITPPNNAYYDIIASQGPAGAGTGDMLSASNLSDVASPASSRSNLGISAVNTPFNNAGTPLSSTNVNTAIADSITRLGTAATSNKQTAVTDSTAERLLIVGAMANLLGFNPAGNGMVATNVDAAIKEVFTALENIDLSAYAQIAGTFTFSGGVRAVTRGSADNSTLLATTAYVKNQGYATLASPELTGTPTAPTQTSGSNNTRIATTAFVKSVIPAAYTPPTTYQALHTYSTYGQSTAMTIGSTSGLPGPGTWRIMGVTATVTNTVLGQTTTSFYRYLVLRIA